MRNKIVLFLTLVFLQSCFHNSDNNKQGFAFLKACNEVDILFFNQKNILTYNTKDSFEISILTDLISGRQDAVGNVCNPKGKIIYKSNGQPIFNAEFSTSDSNDEVDCNFVVYNSSDKKYLHRLTYRSGRLLEDILWDKLRNTHK